MCKTNRPLSHSVTARELEAGLELLAILARNVGVGDVQIGVVQRRRMLALQSGWLHTVGSCVHQLYNGEPHTQKPLVQSTPDS